MFRHYRQAFSAPKKGAPEPEDETAPPADLSSARWQYYFADLARKAVLWPEGQAYVEATDVASLSDEQPKAIARSEIPKDVRVAATLVKV